MTLSNWFTPMFSNLCFLEAGCELKSTLTLEQDFVGYVRSKTVVKNFFALPWSWKANRILVLACLGFGLDIDFLMINASSHLGNVLQLTYLKHKFVIYYTLNLISAFSVPFLWCQTWAQIRDCVRLFGITLLQRFPSSQTLSRLRLQSTRSTRFWAFRPRPPLAPFSFASIMQVALLKCTFNEHPF